MSWLCVEVWRGSSSKTRLWCYLHYKTLDTGGDPLAPAGHVPLTVERTVEPHVAVNVKDFIIQSQDSTQLAQQNVYTLPLYFFTVKMMKDSMGK